MKPKIYHFILPLLLIVYGSTNGQTLTARGGLNVSTILLKHSIDENYDYPVNEAYGFHVGIMFENKFGNSEIFGVQQTYLGFKTGVFLNQKGYQHAESDKYHSNRDVKLYYADIPVLLSMGYKKNKLGLNFSAGFYFGKGLWGKSKYYSEDGNITYHNIKFTNNVYNKIDYGYCFGFEFMYERVSAGAYLYNGLADVSASILTFDVYRTINNQLLEISIGYQFKIFKK
jgi:hypothetical protein